MILLIGLNLLGSGCTNPQLEYSERTFIRSSTNDSFVIRSYPELDLDSIWRYSVDEEIVAIYTADSIQGCTGTMKLRLFSGELHGVGKCVDGFYDGMWKFYKKSGELHFLNFYSRGVHYQRWILDSGDTTKWLYPIIDIEPVTAYVYDTISVHVDVILDGLDTTNWEYYIHFDFIERNRYENESSLPYERYVVKYDGQPINRKFSFIAPEELAMYGNILGINQEKGDSIFHREIMNQFLTILDSTTVEL